MQINAMPVPTSLNERHFSAEHCMFRKKCFPVKENKVRACASGSGGRKVFSFTLFAAFVNELQ